ncbi:MAG: RDD family protein [Verrucomicrobiae bacterium]|nr:RDD family protein [Verrucomicrobiae bacterium]
MKTIITHTLILSLILCGGLSAQNPPDSPENPPEPPSTAEVTQPADAGTVVEEPDSQAAEQVLEEASEAATAEVEAAKASGSITVEPVEEEDIDYINRNDIVTISNNSHLSRNERAKDMVTIMGNSVAEGRIDGDMVTVLGNATLDGYVDGDFVVVMGSAKFGPEAEVDGDVVVIGGGIDADPASSIEGERVSIPFFSPGMVEHFQQLPLFVRECIFLGRPISPNIRFTLYIAGVFLLFYILLAALFPRQMERSRKVIEDKPLSAFFAGVLVLACYIPFVIILLITVVGALLVPIADLALISIAIFGKAVAFFFIGKQIARAIRAGFLEHPMLSIIIGGVLVYALYMIPFFGLFLFLLLSVLGLGAVSVAIGDSISEKKAARQAAAPTPPRLPSGQIAGATMDGTSGEQALPQPGTPLSQIDPATASLFTRVGFWWRAFATLIDLLIVGAITSVLSIATPIIPLFAYFIIFWGWKGSTLGGMALGLRIQKLSGEPIDWSTAIIRSLSAIVSFLPFFIGFFWAGWDPDRQSWHDKIAGTTVVQIPKGYTWN